MSGKFPAGKLAVGRGITLIEMLIAIAVSLIVLLAVIRVFDQLNSSMNASKATIEQAGELRNVTQRLQDDLDGLTASTLPWTPMDLGDGYFEYIEGSQSDLVGQHTTPGNNSYWGDRDDLICFTSRSKGKPFLGRYNGSIIESELAEIIWWIDDGGDANDLSNNVIRRRVLLIRPDLNNASGILAAGGNTATYQQNNDISVRSDGTNVIANSLADLTLRQNRVAHRRTPFPHEVLTANLPTIPAGHTNEGIDVVLDRVAAFDVRVYDPLAPLKVGAGNEVTLAPGDIGWNGGTAIGAQGAFVDLNYANDRTISYYSGPPNPVSRPPLNQALTVATYSTWPEFYERDGENQDFDTDATSGAQLIDEGRDGFDSGGPIAADDISETETFPPYPHPDPTPNAAPHWKFAGLRGVQVRIRIVEPQSRQVRQATVVSDFLPE